jgi:monofunctional glycosyltransferase
VAKGPRLKLVGRVGHVLLATAAVLFVTFGYVWLTTPDVRGLRLGKPGETAFMRLRRDEALEAGKPPRISQRWVAYSQISPSLKRAVLVTEDAAFWDHDGLDYGEIKASLEQGLLRGEGLRGASTITQQLAKNLYLSPSRNPYRKLKELFLARRLEAELPKARILELYLNVIEWGEGIWGAEAAAQTYFRTPAAALDAEQSALLAASIFSPRQMNPARPSARLTRRQQMVLRRMGHVTPPPAAPPPTLNGFPIKTGVPPGLPTIVK